MAELAERMTSEEFTLWAAFYGLEPWGCEIDNWRMGMIAATVVNATPRGPRAKAFKPGDFYRSPYAVDKAVDDLTPQQRAFLERKRKKRLQDG